MARDGPGQLHVYLGLAAPFLILGILNVFPALEVELLPPPPQPPNLQLLRHPQPLDHQEAHVVFHRHIAGHQAAR